MSDSEWRCPHCGQPMSGPDESCSGSFLDTDHPSNVRAQRSEPTKTWDEVDADPVEDVLRMKEDLERRS